MQPPIRTILFIASLFVSAIVHADAQDWKLRPLKYNNPGLTVDLGVGLWAWPMPIDYDRDGDLDLLVGCPDKPSMGVYFFENPTQNPKEKMPLFKPGVRLGDASHYMTVSDVDGQAVIMRPQYEYRPDPKTGKYDFAKPKKIYPRSKPDASFAGRTRGNMWRYVDYDGDGDHDILCGLGDWTDLGWDHAYDNRGVWRNGPLHGYVYLIENQGSYETPKYSNTPLRLQAGGGDIDVYGWPCPNFADFDDDGDLDLLCGEFLDGFTYFQNVGTRSDPNYAAGIRLSDDDGNPLVMHLQMITPTAVDWDSDGDIDLIVGDEDGRVALVENSGKLRDEIPVFYPPTYFKQEADTLKFGALATPFAYDIDDDGDEDIVCGNSAGSIGIFTNLGNGENGLPKWSAPELIEVGFNKEPFRVMAGPNGSIQGPCEAKWGYTTLSVADFDSDGDGDIFYNSIWSRLGMLINDNQTFTPMDFDTGLNEMPPRWYWWQTQSSSALTQWRTTPFAIDFDNDKTIDLVMLDQEGYLTLRRSGAAAERIFLNENRQTLRLNSGTCGRSGRVKLAVTDWDGDSRLDVLVNSENAMWYRNVADDGPNVILKRMGNLANRNIAGHTSSPCVCDFDRDSKPDLLVGSENGRIYHLAHEDAITFPSEHLSETKPASRKEYSIDEVINEEFVFEKAKFDQCHASTICETSRGLVTAWFGGSKEGNKDVGIWSSYHDGQKWNGPFLVADGVQHEGLRYPCWNPVLHQPPGDAPTLLFFKVGPSPREWWGEMMISYDRGRSFRQRTRLPEGIAGPVRSKPILLDDGRTLLCGSSTENDGWRVHFERALLVDGQPSGTWQRIGPIESGHGTDNSGNKTTQYSAIQPTFLKHNDGRLQVLCRTREGVIATSFSSDDGNSWSPLQGTDLPNPNSGIEALTLHDGRHLLVYNHIGDEKNPTWGRRGLLNLAISEDGINWRSLGDLEQEKKSEFSYPAMIQSADGKVHLTYTWKRHRIKHIVLDPMK